MELPEKPTLYTYHPMTGEYTGETKPEYDLLHLQKANVLKFMDLPFTTDKKPPEIGDNEKAIFADGQWSVIKDFRGQVWYNGTVPMTITNLGDPTEYGLTPQPNAPVDPDAEKKQRVAELMTQLNIVSQQIGAYRSSEKIPQELLDRRERVNRELNELVG